MKVLPKIPSLKKKKEKKKKTANKTKQNEIKNNQKKELLNPYVKKALDSRFYFLSSLLNGYQIVCKSKNNSYKHILVLACLF